MSPPSPLRTTPLGCCAPGGVAEGFPGMSLTLQRIVQTHSISTPSGSGVGTPLRQYSGQLGSSSDADLERLPSWRSIDSADGDSRHRLRQQVARLREALAETQRRASLLEERHGFAEEDAFDLINAMFVGRHSPSGNKPLLLDDPARDEAGAAAALAAVASLGAGGSPCSAGPDEASVAESVAAAIAARAAGRRCTARRPSAMLDFGGAEEGAAEEGAERDEVAVRLCRELIAAGRRLERQGAAVASAGGGEGARGSEEAPLAEAASAALPRLDPSDARARAVEGGGAAAGASPSLSAQERSRLEEELEAERQRVEQLTGERLRRERILMDLDLQTQALERSLHASDSAARRLRAENARLREALGGEASGACLADVELEESPAGAGPGGLDLDEAW